MRVNTTERIGVYKSALIFSEEIKWIFREQPIMDVGIDALIEEAINSNPTGKFLAAQIKTGKGNFHESEENYTLYVSNIHYHYWLNLDLPIIIIAHIPEDNNTYWEQITIDTLVKTETQWKILIQKNKILSNDSRIILETIVKSKNIDDFIIQLLHGKISADTINSIVSDSEEFANSHKDLETMVETLEEFTSGVIKYTARITYLVNKGLNIKNKYVKKTIEDCASLMNKSADKLNKDIENFSIRFSKGFRATEKLSIAYFELTQDYANLRLLYNNINVFVDVISETIKNTISMRDSASAIPTEHNKLAKSRKYWIDTCNKIINEFKIARVMTSNLAFWLNEKLN